MPDSRTERITFVVGLAAILTLAIALIPAYGHYRSSTAPAEQVTSVASGKSQQTAYRQRATPKPTRPTTSPATKPRVRATKPAVIPTKPKLVAKQVKVSLAATRGDCWLEVRRGGKSGKAVYVGTLVKGKSLSVTAKSFWIRFGAPQNIDVSLNGEAASIPSGTLDVVVSRSGIRAAA